jgi:cytochrome b561
MALTNNTARYGSVAITLHWLIAGALILNIGLGLYMSEILPDHDPGHLAILQLHKSVGLSVLVLSLARLGWRLANPVPAWPPATPPWMRALARATHFLLYFLIIAIPLSGWLLVSASRSGTSTLYFGLFHWPNLPFLATLPRTVKVPLHHDSNIVHVFLAFSAIALIPIHIAGAVYHQWRGEDVLRRMLPETRIAKSG